MTTKTVKLTPYEVNLGTEGSLDTSVTSGVSIQRSIYLDVFNSTNQKIVAAMDGDSIDDTIWVWSSNSNLV